ncbi:MAG: MarR family transcriptional regulator [Elusimicrobiales bacterium]|nr:MarR family transcriptional regulator [Elusimicrobiales bacterium]
MKDLSRYGINPAKNRPYENITYALALVYNVINAQVENCLAPCGLTPVQFNLLMLAAYQNGGNGLKQAEMGKRLIASASNVTKLVEKSVKEGLLSRVQNPQSRRENIIKITAKGQQLIDKVWPAYDQLVRRLTDRIPAKRQRAAAEILNNWLENLQQEDK